MSSCLVVLVTCPTRRHAQRLAKTLVAKRLAACVNILPNVRSVFWWRGHVDQAAEVLLMIKTTAKRFQLLRAAVQAGHPYEIPEIIGLPIVEAHQPYLRWIHASLTSVPSHI